MVSSTPSEVQHLDRLSRFSTAVFPGMKERDSPERLMLFLLSLPLVVMMNLCLIRLGLCKALQQGDFLNLYLLWYLARMMVMAAAWLLAGGLAVVYW